MVIIISDFYKVYMKRRSDRNTQEIPRASNDPSITECFGDIDYVTTPINV